MPGWNFWLQWLLAYTLGSLVGGAIARPLGDAIGATAGAAAAGIVGAAAAGALVGLALGLAQAVVIGRYLKAGTPWIRVSILGSALGSVLGGATEWFALNRLSLDVLPSHALGMAVVGACLGTAQWWAMRKQFSGSGWWILGNVLGLVMGVISTAIATLTLSYLGPAVALFLRPLVGGAVSGGVLVGLLRESKLNA